MIAYFLVEYENRKEKLFNKQVMKRIFLSICLIILLSAPIFSVLAQCPTEGLVPCGTQGCPCQFCHFFALFKGVVDFLLKYIVPSLAVLMLAIGGFMYVLAYANPSEGVSGSPGLISQAKRLITSVFLGLVIIFGAWLIVNFFFQMIGVQKWTRLTDDPATTEKEGWWKVDCPASN